MTEITQYRDISNWLTHLGNQRDDFVAAGWHFAKTLHAGIEQFGRNDQKRMECYEAAASHTGLSVKTLQNMVSMFRSPVAAIATELNAEHGAYLTVDHATKALGLEEEVARSLLTDAIENNWTPEMVFNIAWRKKKVIPVNGNYMPPPVVTTNGASSQATHHLSETISKVNRAKMLTTIGATLPLNMTAEEHTALATYGHVTNDMLNWMRGDHYNRIEDDAQHLARRKGWKLPDIEKYLENKLNELARLNQTDTDTILRNAATARAFPIRTQTAAIGYSHHELLRNQSNEDAAHYLDLAERNEWSVDELDKHINQNRPNEALIIDIVSHYHLIEFVGSTIKITSGVGNLVITQWRVE